METSILRRMFYVVSVVVLASVIGSAVIEELTAPYVMPPKYETGEKVSAGSEGYILSCDGDRIVAYKKGSDKPYIETSRSVSSLPYDIQARLRAGIEFQSEDKLREAINEYCS